MRMGENGSDGKEEGNEKKTNAENMQDIEEEEEEDFILESFENEELPQSDYNTLGLIRSGKVHMMFAQSHVRLSY